MQDGQIKLAPEFQRNAVWPRAAKAYLIDTILCGRPMPLFFFQRGRSAQTGKPIFTVVDGQQRLRSIIEFIDNRFALTQSDDARFAGKKYSDFSTELRDLLFDYDLNVEELSGYDEEDIKNIFVRMNRYVVKLSPQELRHAKEEGAFYDFVEKLGRNRFWRDKRVLTEGQLNRMKAVEFSAEVTILLLEGPQDKKSSVDLYYQKYRSKFRAGKDVLARLSNYLSWISKAIPDLETSRYRKPTDLYSLIGALDRLADSGHDVSGLPPVRAGKRLMQFEAELRQDEPRRTVTRYRIAASQQTDNIEPRETRISILANVVRPTTP